MLSSDTIEFINRAVPCTGEVADLSTQLRTRIVDGFFYFNAARHPQVQRVCVSQANGDYQCIAQCHNGGSLSMLRRYLDNSVVMDFAELQAAVDAVGGRCVMTEEMLNIDVPAGYRIVLIVGDTGKHAVQIVEVL
jgi:hypothetical protein